MILQNLEREPKEPERDLVRDGTSRLIFDHLDRVAGSEWTFGRGKQDQVKEYVGLFFDRLLDEDHRGDVNRLLGRGQTYQECLFALLLRRLAGQGERASRKGASRGKRPEPDGFRRVAQDQPFIKSLSFY